MTCLSNFLVLLPCTILILNCSQANLKKNDEKITDSVEVSEMKTAEFDTEEQKFFPVDEPERTKFKKFLKKMYTKVQLDAVARTFIHHFHCANDHAKAALEDIFKRFKEHFDQNDIKHYIQGLEVKVPDYIFEMHVTNDLWILERLYVDAKPSEILDILNEDFPTPEVSPVTTEKPLEHELEKFFRSWYYIITVQPCDFPDSFTLLYFQFLLDEHFTENQHKYTDKDTFFRICAAHLARSYLLTCAVHHYWIERIEDEIALPQNKKVEFESAFLDAIPTWYMDEEQITILNILRTAVPQKTKTVDQIQVLHIQDPRAVRGKDGETNVIPFLISRECGVLDWDKAITSKYLPRDRIDILHKRPL